MILVAVLDVDTCEPSGDITHQSSSFQYSNWCHPTPYRSSVV
jgi:hypothetical protein